MEWPRSAEQLVREQERLAAATPPPWLPGPEPYSTGGCFVCFPRGKSGLGAIGDTGWAGAALIVEKPSPQVPLPAAWIGPASVPRGRGLSTSLATGPAGAPYEAGLLALREGALLEAAVRGLPHPPAVLLVNATGRDHPRRAGLALHLGALLDVPSVGVTHRPLLATGDWPPEPERGARSPLLLQGELVGHWLRTRAGSRPLAIHAAWRTHPETAVAVVLRASTGRGRTPEPIRQARRIAREARTAAERTAP